MTFTAPLRLAGLMPSMRHSQTVRDMQFQIDRASEGVYMEDSPTCTSLVSFNSSNRTFNLVPANILIDSWRLHGISS